MPIKMNETYFKKLVEPYKEEALKTLKEFVEINSILDPETATEEMPFGKGVENALAYIAEVGEKMGFKVDRCDNYVTELTYGEGDKILDIYGHADVVPVKEENWTGDPFKMRIVDDNILYGRGTSDDKGPALSCLYAVKALMDNGMLGHYKLRFLFGGNEENDSLCLKHYFEDMKRCYPTYGFSPDAEYPLIYAEKNIYSYRATYRVRIPGIENFAWGSALNVVLAEADCKISESRDSIENAIESYRANHTDVKISLDGDHLSFLGKPYHGSAPWNGINAGLHLLNFLGEVFNIDALKAIFADYQDGKGERFGGNFKDQYFSETSYNVGKIEYDNGVLTLYVNMRFPADLKADTVLEKVKNTKAEIRLLGGSDGFVANPNSDFVKILLHSYQEETGDFESKPLAIGGGTYARETKNTVAFGSQFIGRDYRMHGDDEFFPLSDFYDSMQIYAHAIYELGEYIKKEGK